MAEALDKTCDLVIDGERCDGELSAHVEVAAHDSRLLDVVVCCEACGRTTCGFLSFANLVEVTP
jgi:hypothetical protein